MKLRVKVSHLKLAVLLSSLLLLGGCAIHKGPSGQIQFGLDEAEILGETVGTFQLSDGSEGRIRVLGGRFSVKLQKYLRVIPIQGASSVKVVSATTVGDRTLVILEKSEANCSQKTQLYAIKDAQVSGWDFGDCNQKPQISFNGDYANFDFVNPRVSTRYAYHDGKVLRGDYPAGEGGLPGTQARRGKPIDDSTPRYVPPPPVAVGDAPLKPSTATSKTASLSKPAPAKTKPAAIPPAPPQAMKFQGQEQKATIVLVLDK